MKSLIIAALAAVLTAATAGAQQQFEQTVADTLKADGTVVRMSREQKDLSAQETPAFMQETEFIQTQGRGPGGDRGGNRGGDRGGNRGGNDRGGDHRGGNDHRGEPPHREPPHQEPPHREPPHREPPQHRQPDWGHQRRDHRDWGRWQGHPGWGHHYDRWAWDRFNHPIWWGWVVFAGGSRLACYEHYDMLKASCNNACATENIDCVQECSGWDDAGCVAQCNENVGFCNVGCAEERNSRVLSCPF